MEKPKFLKVYCNRHEKTFYINVNFILSFYENQGWGKTKIEFKGNQGYNNHGVHVNETTDEILSIINNL